jgi:hypothetical protein
LSFSERKLALGGNFVFLAEGFQMKFTLLVIAAATVLLLFIGIHNAWDVVTYLALEYSQPQNKCQD